MMCQRLKVVKINQNHIQHPFSTQTVPLSVPRLVKKGGVIDVIGLLTSSYKSLLCLAGRVYHHICG